MPVQKPRTPTVVTMGIFAELKFNEAQLMLP